MSDHLEIIGPSGEVQFYSLDAGRGVTTIGRAPSNDLRLEGARVADYAATLDHRQRPFTLMAMSDGTGVRVNGALAPALQPLPVSAWDSVEIDGFMLIVAEDEATASVAPTPATVAPVATTVALLPSPAAPASAPPVAPAAATVQAPAGALVAVSTPAASAPVVAAVVAPTAIVPVQAALAAPGELPVFGGDIVARSSDLILSAVRQRVQTIDVGQVAVWEIEVTNASRYVAEFDVSLEGPLPAQWVTIAPNNFNLIERETKTVAITIAPPRQSSTLAGRYNFAIVVASDEVRGTGGVGGATIVERAAEPALLVVNPFFEFAVDPPQPEVAQARYRQRSTFYSLPIRNNGNSSVRYRIEAADTSGGCAFQYFTAQGTPLDARTVLIGPLQPAPSPVLIQATPLRRRIIGAGPRTYDLTFTVTPVDGLATPFPTRARLAQMALFGRWVIALMALLVAILLLIIFRPRINQVQLSFTNPQSGLPEQIFSRADRTGAAAVPAIPAAAAGDEGAAAVAQNQLLGTSGVSQILPDAEVRAGDSVTITWDAANGGNLVLYPEGQEGSALTQVDDRAGVANGSFRLPLSVPVDDTGQPTDLVVIDPQGSPVVLRNYQLSVSNWIRWIPLLSPLGVSQRTLRIGVLPALVPSVDSFAVSPASAVTGERVALDWSASLPNSGDQLFLQQRQGGVVVAEELLAAPVGTLVLTPVADTEFRLVPRSSVWLGNAEPQATAQFVSVSTPVPTRVPTPAILRLDIQPLQIVAGNPITISYTISGATSSQLRFIGLPTPFVDLPAPIGELPVMVPAPGRFSVSLASARLPDGSTDPADPRAGRAEVLTTRVAIAPTATASPTPTLSPTPTPQIPVIEVLALSPNEIVRGDTNEVLLTWNVLGDADQIEISAPEFSFTSTKKKDSVSVPRDQGRVFVMTVFLGGEPLASGSVELKVLEPTPTPVPPTPEPPPPTATPTGTPVPPPRIVAFGAAADGIRREIQNGIDVFFVDGGAEVVISWDVTDATNVNLRQNSSSGEVQYEQRLAKDQIAVQATGASTFIMDAYNNPEGVDVNDSKNRGLFGKVSRTIRLELNAAITPDAPTNVSFTGGSFAEDPVVINWEYNPLQVDRILGFRIYRAQAGSNDFVRVAGEDDLNNSARTWTDSQAPLCSRVYYVVAVYQDLTQPGTDKTVETDSGSTSFLTPPCQ